MGCPVHCSRMSSDIPDSNHSMPVALSPGTVTSTDIFIYFLGGRIIPQLRTTALNTLLGGSCNLLMQKVKRKKNYNWYSLIPNSHGLQRLFLNISNNSMVLFTSKTILFIPISLAFTKGTLLTFQVNLETSWYLNFTNVASGRYSPL